jgi:uncharacterized protein (DUF433 family)
MRMQKQNFYGGQDPREMLAYGISEVAHYLQIPPSTLRSWVKGRNYPTEAGPGFFEPLIALPEYATEGPPGLSFMNVIEAHVLDALRREHRIAMHKVREALTYVEQLFPSKHPLADQKFETDGIDLFVDRYGQLINLTQQGQLAMRTVLRDYLSRIERDTTGVPIKLYLFTRTRSADEPKVIAMDPYVSFGRPVLEGTGITTTIIAERYKAGESIEELARDYACPPPAIQEAIRCELDTKAA